LYDLVDDYLERREPLRPEHLARAQEAHDRGDLALAGALVEPADMALLAFTVDDPAVVEDFVRRDPYVREGLVKGWKIRRWNVVIS
jgi:uncharacterized protein YciI